MTGDPDEARVRALLGAHPLGRGLAAAPLVPLGSGALNRCWRADTEAGPRFVRLGSEAARELGADWASEAALLSIASERALAPKPILAIPDAGLLVTEFVAGRSPDAEEAVDPRFLARIGRLLAELHALTPPSDHAIRGLDFAAQARRLAALCRQDTAAHRRLERRARATFARLAARREALAPCHNDVHRANVLDDGRRLQLVDWEYGGIGDPGYDLAGYVSHHVLDVDAVQVLLGAYGGAFAIERVLDACWAYDFVQWLWYRSATARTTKPDIRAELVKRGRELELRLDRAG